MSSKYRPSSPQPERAPKGAARWPERSPLTINDISRSAGVSKATVSRVLNSPEKVKESTRAKVLAIIQKSNYEPSSVARSLARRRTSTVGLVLDDISNPFFMELAKGVESILSGRSYTMLFTSSGWVPDREVEIVRLLIRQRVDGVLIAPIDPDSPAIAMLMDAGIPLVLMNCRGGKREVGWVTTDNVEGGYVATRYAIDLGYKRILCLHGFEHQTTNERTAGYRKAIAEAGEPIEPIVIPAVKSDREGYEVVGELVERYQVDREPTAIFANNDFVAMAVIEGLLARGIRVPEQVSVIGFDDIRFAAKFRIPLTTVAQAKFKMGEIAASEIMREIAERSGHRTFLLKPQLVVRESTIRPPGLKLPELATSAAERT